MDWMSWVRERLKNISLRQIDEWTVWDRWVSIFLHFLLQTLSSNDDNCRIPSTGDTAELHMFAFRVAHYTRSYPDGWERFVFLFAPTNRRRFYCKMSSCSIHHTHNGLSTRSTFSSLPAAPATEQKQKFSDNWRSSVRVVRDAWDTAGHRCPDISVCRERERERDKVNLEWIRDI